MFGFRLHLWHNACPLEHCKKNMDYRATPELQKGRLRQDLLHLLIELCVYWKGFHLPHADWWQHLSETNRTLKLSEVKIEDRKYIRRSCLTCRRRTPPPPASAPSPPPTAAGWRPPAPSSPSPPPCPSPPSPPQPWMKKFRRRTGRQDSPGVAQTVLSPLQAAAKGLDQHQVHISALTEKYQSSLLSCILKVSTVENCFPHMGQFWFGEKCEGCCCWRRRAQLVPEAAPLYHLPTLFKAKQDSWNHNKFC